MQKKVILITDGACIGNPGPGGWYQVISPVEISRKYAWCPSSPRKDGTRLTFFAFLSAISHRSQSGRNTEERTANCAPVTAQRDSDGLRVVDTDVLSCLGRRTGPFAGSPGFGVRGLKRTNYHLVSSRA
jgi:hypothetical protein